MSDLVLEWCEYHHNLNNISHSHRVMQLRVLRALEATLPGPITGVQARDLERYMAQMVRDGYHPHTVAIHLKTFRPFLRWMWNQEMLTVEQWFRLQEVRGPRGAYDGKPRPYTRAEIRRFWAELDERYPWTRDEDETLRTPARGEHWVRRWAEGRSPYRRVWPYARRLQVEAIIALALYGGLRRNEIYTITLEDMHYQNEYIRVRSRKGRDGTEKIRVVAMNDAIVLGVGNWIEFREQVMRPEHDFPWLNLYAGGGNGGNTSRATDKMSRTRFEQLLKAIGGGWKLHRLRHTFATERYRAGMPLEILQLTLGHSDIKRTLGYAKIDEDRIIAASKASDRKFLKALQNATSENSRAIAQVAGNGTPHASEDSGAIAQVASEDSGAVAQVARNGTPHISRADRLLALIAAQPGITMNEIAEQLGGSYHTNYAVARRLMSSGAIERVDGGWQLTESGAVRRRAAGWQVRPSPAYSE